MIRGELARRLRQRGSVSLTNTSTSSHSFALCATVSFNLAFHFSVIKLCLGPRSKLPWYAMERISTTQPESTPPALSIIYQCGLNLSTSQPVRPFKLNLIKTTASAVLASVWGSNRCLRSSENWRSANCTESKRNSMYITLLFLSFLSRYQ